MKNYLIKTFSILAILAFANIAIAKDSSCNTCETCEPCEPCKPCCTEVPQTGEPCNCAYNAPARIDTACGWDAWVSSSFIYWQPKQQDLELGRYETSDITGSIEATSSINLETDYHPGFKIGIGASTERDNWTLYLEYTRLKSSDSVSKNIQDIYSESNPKHKIRSIWLLQVSGSTFSYAEGTWDLNYNILNLDLDRPFYLGKKLILKPHFGIQGGWIDQKYNINVIQEIGEDKWTQSNANKQDSWLIGAKSGIESSWLLDCNFRIFGNIAGALSYQKFKTSFEQKEPMQYTMTADHTYTFSNNFSQLTPAIDLSLGLGYGTYFYNNEWHFDLAIGYDFNYIWNQGFMKRNNDLSVYGLNDNIGNLMLHGLSITAKLDF